VCVCLPFSHRIGARRCTRTSCWPAGWCVLRHIHINKYLLNYLLIIAFNNKIMLSRLAHPARRCVGHQPRGQKTDIGCRRQRREHNPPFRRSSEHSAARLAASSVRLYSPHSRPPVSRCRRSCVGQGLQKHEPARAAKCLDGRNRFRWLPSVWANNEARARLHTPVPFRTLRLPKRVCKMIWGEVRKRKNIFLASAWSRSRSRSTDRKHYFWRR